VVEDDVVEEVVVEDEVVDEVVGALVGLDDEVELVVGSAVVTADDDEVKGLKGHCVMSPLQRLVRSMSPSKSPPFSQSMNIWMLWPSGKNLGTEDEGRS